MCDYSLQDIASRPPKVGDELVAAKFAGSATRGFSAIGQPNVAVCLLPGTEIALEKEAEYRVPVARLFAGFENETRRAGSFAHLFSGLRVVRGKVARFRQVDLTDPYAHHDALEFADGQTVLLTALCAGQRATVLQLPAQPRAEQESAAAKRSELVS